MSNRKRLPKEEAATRRHSGAPGTWLAPDESTVPKHTRRLYALAQEFFETPAGIKLMQEAWWDKRVLFGDLTRPPFPLRALGVGYVLARGADVAWAKKERGYVAPIEPLVWIADCHCRPKCSLQNSSLNVFLSLPGQRVNARMYMEEGAEITFKGQSHE